MKHPALALALAAWSQAASAGTLYVNGVRADGLRGYEFNAVTVRVDEKGDVWIDAPQYRVEVDTTMAAAATGGPTTGYDALAPGTWWLVSEDNGSYGHTVDVIVNGNVVRRVRSGDAQVILDVSPYLHRGNNIVTFNTTAGPRGDGGLLNLYVGIGSNRSGTVVLDRLDVTFARRAQDAARSETRTFQLQVP